MTVRGHFDGKVVILDEAPPADWQPNMAVQVVVTPHASDAPTPDTSAEEDVQPNGALMKILEMAKDLGLPPDFSEQHDHYIHGTPKK